MHFLTAAPQEVFMSTSQSAPAMSAIPNEPPRRRRIVSLIASATEIVHALGMGDALVARSHECDYPPRVRRLPVVTAPAFDVEGSSREIDERVKATLASALSVYQVDRGLLHDLQPDVIITQSHCDVCAVSDKDVQLALGDWPGVRPRVVTLEPNALKDIWHGINDVAAALDVPERGTALVQSLQHRLAGIAERAQTLPTRPSVACLEWLDPLMAAGNWIPELVELAGGMSLFGVAGKHAPWLTWEQLAEHDPDAIVALPCGFDLARTRAESICLKRHPAWPGLRAVRNHRVLLTDGNQFFNRPGPRVVESLEILAEILHPECFHFGHEGVGWEKWSA
jgi:iron complex transport system substrate-binding protein